MRRQRLAIYALFFASGAVGLVYEICWLRMFRLVMGNTVYTSATVLTAFMGGLALGSWGAGRWADGLARPLRAYGWLELLVGAYAILLPLLLVPAAPLYGWLYSIFPQSGLPLALGRFAISSALLLLPTTLMGATLPLLARVVSHSLDDVGRDVGRLYGLNTIGAAAGAAIAGFLLVPVAGQGLTLASAALGSLAIGAVGLALDRAHGPATSPGSTPAAPTGTDGLRRAVVWGLGAAGFASMVYEVAWTRTLTQLIGSSVYAFTLMLVAFIAGLGLGGIVLSGFVDRRRNPVLFLGGLQLAVAAASLLVVPFFGRMPVYVVDLVTRFADSFAALHGAEFATVFALMFVPTFAMGGVFPTVARIYARRLDGLGRSVGEAYAANTLGAVLGSFAAGFLLVPGLGVRGAILVAVAMNAALGIGFWLASGWGPRRRRLLVAAALAAAAAGGLWQLPAWDAQLLNSAPYLYAYRYKAHAVSERAGLDEVMTGNRRLLYDEEGLTATVTVVESGGELYLKVNGKTDASSRGDLRSQSLLAHLPLLLHPAPRRALLVGLGSGISLGALEDHPVTEIECVEISPEVIHAARLFHEANGDALRDPRVRLIVGDGRNHVAHAEGHYDVIVSQPSNLWIAGMADLFTAEYFEACRRHLAPGGLMCSWVQAYSMRADDFRTIAATFASVFPHVTLWESVPGGDYFLIGADRPLALSREELVARAGERRLDADLERIGVGSVDQILSCFAVDGAGVAGYAAGAPANTDDSAALEFSAPRGLYEGLVGGAGTFQPDQLDPFRPPGLDRVLADAVLPASQLDGWRARRAARDALVRMNRAELAPALEGLREASRLNPDDMEVRRLYPEVALALGAQLEEAGRLEEAGGLYGEALGSAPGDGQLHLRLGRVHEAAGRDAQALASYEAAVAAEAHFVPAYLRLAAARVRLGLDDRAEDAYRQAAAVDSANAAVHNEWGKLCLRQGRWDDAIATFRRGLAAAPGDAQMANNLGVAWAQKGVPATAADWFRRATELSPGYARAWVNLGDACRALGRRDEARRAYSQALAAEPGNPRAQRGLQGL